MKILAENRKQSLNRNKANNELINHCISVTLTGRPSVRHVAHSLHSPHGPCGAYIKQLYKKNMKEQIHLARGTKFQETIFLNLI